MSLFKYVYFSCLLILPGLVGAETCPNLTAGANLGSWSVARGNATGTHEFFSVQTTCGRSPNLALTLCSYDRGTVILAQNALAVPYDMNRWPIMYDAGVQWCICANPDLGYCKFSLM